MNRIWDGIKSIIVGGVKIIVGVGQATWALLKFAIKAALWVIAGVFLLAQAGVQYLKKVVSKIFKPKEIIVVPQSSEGLLSKFLNEQVAAGNVTESEEDLVITLSEKCSQAKDNDQILIMAKGNDENGEEALADPQFVKADDYQKEIKDADKAGNIYVQKIKVA